MLFSTSLLAVVGAGEQPALSPRRVSILNTAERSVIADLYFRSAVLAVRLSRARLVVVQASAVAVYALATLQALESIPTVANPRGVVALSQCAARPLLALPGAAGEGVVLVRDAGGSGHTLCELHAHRTPLAALAFSPDGSLLASASEKGTVIRIHALPSAQPVATLRRGLAPAAIASLAFGPRTAGPPLLVAASDTGTVHVFRVDPPGASAPPAAAENAQELAGRSATARATAAAAAACSAAAGAVVATLLPRLPRRLRRPVRDSLEAQRAAVTVRLGGGAAPPAAAGSAAAAAAAGLSDAAAVAGGMLGLTHAPAGGPACRAVVALAPPRADDAAGASGAAARLVLATWAGVYQEHRVTGLAPAAPRADAASCLEREGALLAPTAADDDAAMATTADGEHASAAGARWLPGDGDAAAAAAAGDDARPPAASVHASAELTASVSVSLSRSIMGAPPQWQ